MVTKIAQIEKGTPENVAQALNSLADQRKLVERNLLKCIEERKQRRNISSASHGYYQGRLDQLDYVIELLTTGRATEPMKPIFDITIKVSTEL